MNNKITFPELVERIAEITKTSKRVSELFLKELFGVIKERLEQGETVKIKNLGTFKVTEVAARKSVNVNTGAEMEIASHRKVTFTPDKSLAEAVNAPFEEFETIVLDDDINEDTLDSVEVSDIRIEEQEDVIDELPPVFVEKNKDTFVDTNDCRIEVAEENHESDLKEQFATEQSEEDLMADVTQDEPNELCITEISNVEELDAEAEVADSDSEDDNFVEEVKTEKRKSFVWGFIGGIVTFIVIGCIAIAICDSCFGDFVPNVTEKKNTVTVAVADNAVDTVVVMPDTVVKKNIEPVKDVPKTVTDTVRVNYYLTKMSRKYYGRYEFWVYIYEENKDKIKNPDKVAPGLVVVIPPAEKYGIDKNDAESVEKAKKLAEKI